MALDIVLWAFCAVVLAQLVVSTILISTDLLRKRRRAPTAFPWLSLDPAKVEGNELRLYTYGEELYADMLSAIQRAERQVLFETFIWKDDAVGRDFKRQLSEAAARGVEVYIIFDSFANLVVPRRFKRFPRQLHVLEYPLWPRIWQILDPR